MCEAEYSEGQWWENQQLAQHEEAVHSREMEVQRLLKQVLKQLDSQTSRLITKDT